MSFGNVGGNYRRPFKGADVDGQAKGLEDVTDYTVFHHLFPFHMASLQFEVANVLEHSSRFGHVESVGPNLIDVHRGFLHSTKNSTFI